MINMLLKNVNVGERTMISIDTDLLRNAISENSKKIDRDIRYLKEFSRRLELEVAEMKIRYGLTQFTEIF